MTSSIQPKACALCKTPLTRGNNSKEHLIPRSIGGRKKVRGFICIKCNNNAGETWDTALAKSLNPLSLLCRIKREGNDVPSQEFSFISGEAVLLKFDGSMTIPHPLFSKTERNDGKLEYHIKARTPEEADRMLKGLKKKHPDFNLEEARSKFSHTELYPDSPLHIPFQFGGAEAGRSLVKTALAWAVENGIDADNCGEAIAYLTDKEAPACFGYYYEKDIIANRELDKVLHCVAISNTNTQGQLLAYIEYFSAQRMVVRLTDNYSGKDVHAIYAIDPIKGEEVSLIFNLSLSRQDVQDTYNYKKCPKASHEAAFGIPLSIANQNDFISERDKQIADSVDYAYKNCGIPEGGILDEAAIRKMPDLIIDKLAPFLIRHMPNRNWQTNKYVGPNKRCPCGSGKKHKKCCLK